MTAIAANRKVGRRSRVEVAERIAFVRKLVEVHGRDRAKVHADFVDLYGPTPARTIDAYLARLDDEWLQKAKADATDERSRFLIKLERDDAVLREAKAWGPLMTLRKLEARVLGLDVQQVALSGAVHVTAARAEVRELSEGEDAEIRVYLAEKVAARAALDAANDTADAATVVVVEGANGDAT